MKKIIPILLSLTYYISCSAQINGTFNFESLNRSYITYLPTSYTASKSYPLVVVLHGFTQTASGIMNYSGFNAIAESEQFIVVYPNGTGLLQSWNSNMGATGVNDLGFINALLDTIQTDYSINPSQVFVTGFSNGSFMSHRLLCETNRFAAAATVGGPMQEGTYTNCNPSRKIRLLQIHGTLDAIVNYNGTIGTNKSIDETTAFWVQANNCSSVPSSNALPDLVSDNTTVDSIQYTACALNGEVQLLRINGGGHQWPNSIGNSGIGTICKDIEGSKRIWEFFKKSVVPNSLNKYETKNDLLVYPNPSHGRFIVQLNSISANEELMSIWNMMGEKIKEFSINDQNGTKSVELIVDKWPIGIYILKYGSAIERIIIE